MRHHFGEIPAPCPELLRLLTEKSVLERWRWGIIIRFASFWVGVHYSKKAQRWCVNPVPCITLWIARPGGQAPEGPDFDDKFQINHPLTFFP